MTDLAAMTTLPYDQRTKAFLDYMDRGRAAGPVAKSEQPGVWEVFGYDEALQVLGDFRTFSSDMNDLIPEDEKELASAAQGNFLGVDPPHHTQMRELVRRAFTPNVVARLEPIIAETANRLLDGIELSADGTGTFDVVGEFAAPLTARVIAKLFGIPEKDHGMFTIWADALLGARPAGELGKADESAVRELGELVRFASAYLLGIIHERRAEPQDDLITALTTAEVDGRSLDDHEIVGVIGMFVIAGHLPSSVLIGNTVMSLDSHPDVLAEVRSDPGLLPDVVEEVLRWRSPLVRDQRVAACDTELGGEHIPAGAMVCVWLASAHRDAEQFERAEEFDIHRPNRSRHVAFGKGIHFCLGAPLARMEARIALTALLERFERVEVLPDSGIRFHPSIGVLGPVRLPVAVRGNTPTG
ncbi:cytochrome P450 [Kitasatospora sp. NPDC097691]|uniref:cytochrome P450 n=1 Tax=Kitasatospora sp. NPDC097691 TaxID=3157231 RepID=UPI0033209EFB